MKNNGRQFTVTEGHGRLFNLAPILKVNKLHVRLKRALFIYSYDATAKCYEYTTKVSILCTC